MTADEEKALRKELRKLKRTNARLERSMANLEVVARTHRRVATQIQEDLRAQVIEQAELARQLAAAKSEAEEANEAKSRLLAAISHELRTPMNGVLGTVQLLEDEPMSPEGRELVQVLQGSAVSLIGLVDQLLQFARLEAAEVALKPSKVQLGPLLSDVGALHRANASARGLSLEVELDAGLPDWVEVDDARLKQILTNLLDNALRFTQQGSVTVEATLAPDGVTLAVRDTGEGIPPEVLPGLFKPFRQADAHVWRTHGGSGLGLSITQKLVARLGGELEVESQVGVGTRFHFTLPLVAVSAPQRSIASQYRDDLQGRRVLVVDDNPVNRLVAQRMLQALGCEVLVAEGGQQGVDMVLAGSPELVLMDCSMPEVDGFEATRRIRRAGCELPILALTAMAIPGDRERCQEAGMDDFLAKPVLLPVLRDKLTSWLPPLKEAAGA